ncbi:MAG: cyclophilin-like fold protein [Candidatus Acidiferrales bacterium]
MRIRIKIADKVVIASVADNATARDFVSVLPLNVSML